MLSFDEALRTVVEATDPVAAERVSVFEAAGRILREDIHAPAPLPGFDYSAMDGYAFRHADLGPAPHQLSLVGTSSAGEPLDALAPNSACRIYTGAIVPAGADTVIMQEEVRAEPNRIEFGVAPTLGANIRKTGEDMAAGALALRAGEELHPGRVALAACLDRATLVVSRRPLVSVLGTGDELRSPGELGEVGSVVESNGFFVKAAAERAGASARLQRFARDSEGALDEAIASALEGTDLLITIGGVSVGDRDLVRPALERAGVEISFYKVAMKPGKPITFGRRGKTRVLGLPGNPASSSLTFLLFGLPLIRRMLGDTNNAPSFVKTAVMVSGGSLRRKAGRTEFARARLTSTDKGLHATLLPNQASGAVTSFAQAEALVRIDAEVELVRDGDELPVMKLW